MDTTKVINVRKIKFRAWDKTNKVIVNDENILIDFKGRLWVRHINTKPKLISKLYDKSYIIMQYTGLKDCKGKDIYEGDIFKTNHDVIWAGKLLPKVWEVFYNEKDLQFQGKNKDSPIHEHIYDDVEVIGNIYKNPKLLN